MNVLFLSRVMLFIVGLPVAQIVLFCYSIGHDPKGLNLAVKNFELSDSTMGCPVVPGCNATYLSCRFLRFLEQKSMILVRFYKKIYNIK